jgi:hypothetical protein
MNGCGHVLKVAQGWRRNNARDVLELRPVKGRFGGLMGKRWLFAVALAALLVLSGSALARALPSTSSGGDDGRQTPDTAEAAGMSVAELERLLEPLHDASLDKRLTAAAAVTELGPDAAQAVSLKLADLRKAGPDYGIYPLLKTARAASTSDRSDDGDLLDGLLRLPPTESTSQRIAIMTMCLARALAHAGTTTSVRQLVNVVHDHNGAFRPEIARLVQKLGERATAGLIRASKDPTLPGVTHWASQQLEVMGKKTPGDCVQTKSNEVLSDVLRAYGSTHDLDATSVVLSFVNSDRAQVRQSAREALGMYGQDAIWKLREAYVNLTGKSAPEEWNAPRVAKELFSAYDRFRLQDVYALMDEGIAQQKEGKLDLAVAAFDKVLARQPLFDRRAEMVPAYVMIAQSTEAKDPVSALAYLRKAARLDPEGPRAQQIESEILYLEGMALESRGIADSDLFQRAVAVDAANTRARAELDRLEADADVRQERIRRWAAAGAVMAIAIAGLILFAGRRPNRRAATVATR